MQQIITVNTNNKTLLDKYLNILMPSAVPEASGNEMKRDHDHIDQFYSRERKDHPTESPNE
jgi:hypothetical protein